MSIKSHCLKRIGENVKKHKFILLEDKDEVTIGRSAEVTVCILSDMISRCHAVLKKTQFGTWTITDNNSLNGVFVNDKKLEPSQPYELLDGDVVQLGVKPKPNVPAEFLFRYHTALIVNFDRKRSDTADGFHCDKQKLKRTKLELNEAEADSSIPVKGGQIASEDRVTCSTQSDIKCSISAKHTHPTSDNSVTSSQSDFNSDFLGTRILSKVTNTIDSSYSKYRKEMKDQEIKAAEQLAEMERKLKEMQQLLQVQEFAKNAMAEQLKEEQLERENQKKVVQSLSDKEKELQQELKKKQKQLAKEKEEMKERMREELEDLLQAREASLIESLENQRQALLKEKEEVEFKLKQELESEREKDKKLSEELQHQKMKLEKIIEQKEAEQRLLESQLNDTRQENDRKQEEVLHAREDILSNFADLMETELQCSICNELFVRATSLNCSHSFCSLCISQWMKVKKECPQCRAVITTHMRSIVLDSYIDKMMEQCNDDKKKSRLALVQDRKKVEEAFEQQNKVQQLAEASCSRSSRRGRGRGRRRNVATPVIEEPPLPVLIDDDDDDEDVHGSSDSYHSLSDTSVTNSDEDSDNDIEGDSNAYYGGYGHCYTCGQRGHWANGCPFR